MVTSANAFVVKSLIVKPRIIQQQDRNKINLCTLNVKVVLTIVYSPVYIFPGFNEYDSISILKHANNRYPITLFIPC